MLSKSFSFATGLAILSMLASQVQAGTIHVTNNCPFDINVARGSNKGWDQCQKLAANGKGKWDNAFSGSSWIGGKFSGGVDECNTLTGRGDGGGYTLAEFGFENGWDSWDVSLVAGFNLPVVIKTDKPVPGMPQFEAGCSHDFLGDCPVDLLSANKKICQSAGFARVTLPGLPWESVVCQGDYVGKCPSSNIPHYTEMKPKCPNAFIYPEDNKPADMSVMTGDVGEFNVIFCPNGESKLGDLSNAQKRNEQEESFMKRSRLTARVS